MSRFSPRRTLVRTLDGIASRLPARLRPTPRNDAGATLSPLLHWLLHLRRLVSGADMTDPAPALARQRMRADLLPLAAGYPVREVRELVVPGAAGPLAARHYRPEPEGELPVLLLFFHGGGFVIGDLDTHDDVCRLLCRESGMQVLSVDYRLAPEHPFPAAPDDAEAVTRWAQQNAAQFGVAPHAIAVGGDSAGGNLAAVTAQALAQAEPPLLAQLLIYPGTDRPTPRESHRLFGEGFFLSREDRDWFYHHYLAGDESLGYDIRVSPLLSQNSGVQAPALVVTAGFDMLRDEGEAYAGHLRAHGTEVRQLRVENVGHGFMNLASVHRDSERAFQRIARDWRRLCNLQLSRREQQA